MSALEMPAVLPLPVLARMMRDVRASESERYTTETGLGPDVERFLTYFRTERGKAEMTCTSYEYCLARFATYYADLDLTSFDSKTGTNLIRDFLRESYADVAGGTWNTRVATLKSFFKWAFEESRMDMNPAAIIRYRKVSESERQAHSAFRIESIVVAQLERRDRIGVQLLGRMALRRNELRLVQFKHVNRDTRELTVFGKGGTVKKVTLFLDLFEQIQREASERLAHPDEFLIYPFKTGKVGRSPDSRVEVIWEARRSPMSASGIDKWWQRVLTVAGEKQFPMHELRHSAITNFWRETRDLRMTQKLARHAKVSTTADVYLHDDATDLAEAIDSMPAWNVED